LITYTELHKAIVDKIKTGAPDIAITSTNIEEGITRPSFFVSFDNLKATDFMCEALDRETTVRIYYFPTDEDKNKIEILNMQDTLVNLFLQDNLISVDTDFTVEIEELEFNVIDKVLHCYFELKFYEDYDRDDDTDLMEDLVF
jgi:hypothetical protein